MKLLKFRDNSPFTQPDNGCGNELFEGLTRELSCPIKKLREDNPNLFVFTKGSIDDKKCIIERNYDIDETSPGWATTNLMGVIYYSNGEEEIPIAITSRFDNSEKQTFLTWMLYHVFEGSIHNWRPCTTEGLWNVLLIFLFKEFFKRAYVQGFFKQYVQINYNNYSFKGALDVNTHLKKNIPWLGKIAFTAREFSYDNPVNWMIRLASGKIQEKFPEFYHGVLASDEIVGEGLRIIQRMTPSYEGQNRHRVLHGANEQIRHPFFTEYEEVRKVCVQLLRDEGLNLYEDEPTGSRIHGILFDGAWLWESYIAKILGPLRFTHYEYKRNGIRVYENKNESYLLYPDFHRVDEPSIVLDTKYKHWERNTERNQADVHQVLAYMYLTGSQYGGVIYPKQCDACPDPDRFKPKKLMRKFNNYTGSWIQFPFRIPPTDSEERFKKDVQTSEEGLKQYINGLS